MKHIQTFESFLNEKSTKTDIDFSKPLNEYIVLNEGDFSYLSESERAEVQETLKEFGNRNLSDLDEGLLGNIFGGLTGFLIGPSIGRVIARALGVEKGFLYDMLTSQLVATALGSAISKYISSKK